MVLCLYVWACSSGVIEGGTYGGYAYPAGEEETGIVEAAGEGEDSGRDVGVYGVDG